MMKIDSVASRTDRVGRYLVRFSNGVDLKLYRQTVEDFGLYAGKEMSDDEFEQLQQSAGQMSAKMRAVRIVSATSVSVRDLEQRLVQKGENPDQARAAVQWMAELELLDDRKTAEQIVHSCISKGYGLARAKQALYEKRIPKDIWDEVLDDYPDQLDKILDYLRSRLSDACDEKKLRKVTDALIRRGHGYSQIKKALQILLDDYDFAEEL